MSTHTHHLGTLHAADFQDTVPVDLLHAAPSARRPAISDLHEQHALRWLSPGRAVLFVALVALVVLLLASIAGVAKAQVNKGSDFQFVQQAAPSPSATVYSNRGGTRVAALAD